MKKLKNHVILICLNELIILQYLMKIENRKPKMFSLKINVIDFKIILKNFSNQNSLILN
jgi:hypothetical protein